MLQPRICVRQLWRVPSTIPPKQPSLRCLRRPNSTTTQVPAEPSPFDSFDEVRSVFEPPPLHDPAMVGEKALRRYTPRTPGLRHLVRPVNDHIYKGRPVFKLTFPKLGQGKGGRNHTGRITVRHRGGGHKRRIRIVDFDRYASGEHYVERIEHDPNRTAHIALVTNRRTGAQSYILAAEGLRAGDTVQSYRSGIPQSLLDSMGGVIDPGVLAARTAWRGNCLPLGMIPIGTPVFNISLAKDGKSVYCRSAGTHAFIVGKGEDVVRKELVKKMEERQIFQKKVEEEREQKQREEQLRRIRERQAAAAGKPLEPTSEDPDPDTTTDTKSKDRKKSHPQSLDQISEDPTTQDPPTPTQITGEANLSDLNLTPVDLKKLETAAQYVTVKLSSGEVRLIPRDAVATVGIASNGNHQHAQLGKAGRKRWLGIRPTVRGVAMNAVDHPHGGGRGKGKGNRHPVSPWGKLAKSGKKTRDKHKVDKLIVHQRPRNQGKRRSGGK